MAEKIPAYSLVHTYMFFSGLIIEWQKKIEWQNSWVKAFVMAIVFTIVSVAFFYYYLKLAIPMGLLSSIIV